MIDEHWKRAVTRKTAAIAEVKDYYTQIIPSNKTQLFKELASKDEPELMQEIAELKLAIEKKDQDFQIFMQNLSRYIVSSKQLIRKISFSILIQR